MIGAHRLRLVYCHHIDEFIFLFQGNAKNTTHLNNLPRSTKDTDIPKIEDKDERDNFHSKLLDRIDKFVEQQVRQGNQLEMLNKNLETLIGILAEKRT